jgi:hypothetical protein
MKALFSVSCSSELASALGAKPFKRLSRPHLSFPVYEGQMTHHAELMTENGRFAWLWQLDRDHPTIERA